MRLILYCDIKGISLWQVVKVRLLIIPIVLLLLTTQVNIFSQNVSTYIFTQTTGPYSSISGTSLTLESGSADDGYYPLTNIGFTFNFHGSDFTQFSAATNGRIRLGAIGETSTTNTPLSSYANCIAFGGGDGKIVSSPIYLLSGSAPYRVLTIQYGPYYVYYSGTGDYVNVQIKLYETTNVIEIIYGTSVRSSTYTRQVGISGATTSDFSVRTNSTSWVSSTAAGNNTTTMTWSTLYYPSNGLLYRWTPPPPPPLHHSRNSCYSYCFQYNINGCRFVMDSG
ncbi:MAG TPA: hypothetical protein PKN32_10830 [Bacteroidales bacterium]|nr:hypothetical protein [Bacteroidales bacterium]